jgi:hypothetical protein
MADRASRENIVSERKRQTKLYERDDRYVTERKCDAGKTESAIIRELVSTGRRTQVLRNRGRDVTTKAVRHAQKEVVRETLAPLIRAAQRAEYILEVARPTDQLGVRGD